MSRRTRYLLHSDSRRGSVFIVVVAILAVLALLSLTLSYTAQTETYSARNYSDGVQARVAAFTGLAGFQPFVPPVTASRISTTSAGSEPAGSTRMPVPLSLQLEGQDGSVSTAGIPAPAGESSDSGGMVRKRTVPKNTANGEGLGEDESIHPFTVVNTSLAVNVIEDESAKININTLVPTKRREGREVRQRGARAEDLEQYESEEPLPGLTVDQFADFIQETLRAKGVQTNASAKQLAEAISIRRYGPDRKPGVAGVDDNGNSGSGNLESDGLDNDLDGRPDNRAEAALATDADGIDNNRDGQIDEPGESIDADGLDGNHDGRIDSPNESIDEPAEFNPDIRRPARGDDRPYASLNELLSIEGMTVPIYNALAPHLTVFSVSRPAYQVGPQSNLGFLQIDPNTARPEEIYKALVEAFPTLPKDLIGQFTVNMIDRRDADDEPTEIALGDEGRMYYGLEITPRINEVCPDVATPDEDGDDGQYVELINPHAESIDLSGWRLEGGGTTVWLNGTIPSGGLIVITDDYNNSTDESPEEERGIGSLFDCFGVVPLGVNKRIIEEPRFDLSNDSGTVRLYNPDGALVDKFEYKNGNYTGASLSMQRVDPRLRHYEVNYATPLSENIGAPSFYDENEREIMAVIEKFHNQPFRSPLELLIISTAYAPAELNGRIAAAGPAAEPLEGASNKPWGWRFPSTEGTPGQDNLGAEVVDLFYPGAPQPNKRIFFEERIQEANPADRPEMQENLEMARRTRRTSYLPDAIFGRINVNTASPAVLASLPGFDKGLAQRISELRGDLAYGANSLHRQYNVYGLDAARTRGDAASKTPQWMHPMAPTTPPRWQSFSQFMEDDELWGELNLAERFMAAYPFSRMVTFHTLSLKVTNESTSGPAGENRRPSVMRTERILAGDRGRIEPVSVRYLRPPATADQDPDLRFAEAVGEGGDLASAILSQAVAQSQEQRQLQDEDDPQTLSRGSIADRRIKPNASTQNIRPRQ